MFSQLASQLDKTDRQLIDDALGSLDKERVVEMLESGATTNAQYRAPIQSLLLQFLLDALKVDRIYQATGSKQGKSLVKKIVKDPNYLLNKTLAQLQRALKTKDVGKMISGIVLLQELKYHFSKHDTLKNVERRIKRDMVTRPTDKILSKLLRQLKREVSGQFYKKFLKTSFFGGAVNRLQGNFHPIQWPGEKN